MIEALTLAAILSVANANPVNTMTRDDNELLCLATAIYFEARGEVSKDPDQLDYGQLGVGFVAKNRVEINYRGATSYCGVIHDPKQFSFLNPSERVKIKERAKKKKEKKLPPFDEVAWGKAVGYAIVVQYDLMADFTEGATHYCNEKIATARWCKESEAHLVLGNHKYMHVSALQ